MYSRVRGIDQPHSPQTQDQRTSNYQLSTDALADRIRLARIQLRIDSMVYTDPIL